MSEAPEPQDPKSMIFVFVAAGADLAEIVVAAEVDVVVGRVLALVDVLEIGIDIVAAKVGIGCFDLSTGSGYHWLPHSMHTTGSSLPRS